MTNKEAKTYTTVRIEKNKILPLLDYLSDYYNTSNVNVIQKLIVQEYELLQQKPALDELTAKVEEMNAIIEQLTNSKE